MKKRVLFLFVFIIHFAPIVGQNEMMTWINGWQETPFNPSTPDTGDIKFFGANIISFKTNPPIIVRHRNALSLFNTVINMCDTNGNLLFYSNGSKIFNGNHELIENADSINYNAEWGTYGDNGYYACQHNGRQFKTMMCFRSLSNFNQYYILSLYFTDYLNLPYRNTKIHYSLLDMSLNNGKGKLIKKQIVIDSGRYAHCLSATKHSDGKRWWLLIADANSTSNCYNKLFLDSTGFHVHPKECIGWEKDSTDGFYTYFYDGVFSHDGKKFAFMTNKKGLEVYDFNRCTGTLYNRKIAEYPFNDTPWSSNEYISNMSFSPNNTYLYAGFTNRLYQFDVKSNNLSGSVVRIAKLDTAFKDFNLPVLFGASQLAPNNKIYYGNGGSVRYMHTIHKPDDKGLACDFRQHDLFLQVFAPGIPHFPNYSLGAEKCCGYSMNRSLTVKPDTSLQANDTGTYQWLYCDSNFKAIPNANQVVYKPKKSGRYAIRISNTYCTDTSECVYVQIDTARLLILDNEKNEIRVFPNPVSTKLFIDFRNSNLRYEITNTLGVRILAGYIKKEIDLSRIEEGIYFLTIIDRYDKISTHKIEIRR